jgi:hypothetical protein
VRAKELNTFFHSLIGRCLAACHPAFDKAEIKKRKIVG